MTQQRAIILFILIAILAVPLWTVSALQSALVPTGSLFTEQCDTVEAALFMNGTDQRWLNIKDLMHMAYEPGVWYGYDSPAPLGGTYPYAGERAGQIYLYTPCGEKFSAAWRNADGSILLMALTDNETTDINGRPCTRGDGSERCGNHHFEFGYVSAEEWQRVTGYVFSGDCSPDLDCMASE